MLAEGQKGPRGGQGPRRGAAALTSSGGEEIDVVLERRKVVFRVGTTEVTTRLIEGKI
ncbi:MAG: hypothetical protein U0W40_14495 [Acidimicrobiia bacterium]